MDEAISATAARDFSFYGIVSNFIRSDTHPPLYYLLLKLWASMFGYSEISLRMLSVVFGVLTILVVYKLTIRFGQRAAYYSALLACFSPLLVYYSQEARMYAFTTFLTGLSVIFYLDKKWIYLSFLLLIIAMTDYLPLLILIPFWLMTFLDENYRKEFKSFVLSHLLLLLFALFWYPTFIIQRESTLAFLGENPWWGQLLGTWSIKNTILVWVKFIVGRISFFPRYLYALAVLAPSLLALAGLIRSLKEFRPLLFFWLWLVVPPTVVLLASLFVPGFSYFRLLFVLPAFIILFSIGVSRLNRKGQLIFLSFLAFEIFFSCTYLLNQNFWREDWKGVVSFLENRLKNGESVYISYKEPFTPYVWYSSKDNYMRSFDDDFIDTGSLYTLDYLMDATDPDRKNYKLLEDMGYKNTQVYNFRGVGQVRYWLKQ
jgi:uncharacterized membrane protein